MQEVILKNSPMKTIIFLLISLCFLGIGIFMVIVGAPPVVAWGNTILFGFGTYTFLRQLRDQRPRIVINAAGIYDRRVGVETIPWKDIKDASLVWMPGGSIIWLELNSPQLYARTADAGLWARLPAKEVDQIGITLGGVKANAQQVLALILSNIAVQRATNTQL